MVGRYINGVNANRTAREGVILFGDWEEAPYYWQIVDTLQDLNPNSNAREGVTLLGLGGGGGPLHHVDTEFSVLGWDLLRVMISTMPGGEGWKVESDHYNDTSKQSNYMGYQQSKSMYCTIVKPLVSLTIQSYVLLSNHVSA